MPRRPADFSVARRPAQPLCSSGGPGRDELVTASDAELVRAVVAAGGERGFAQLVGRHERSVRAAAYAVSRDRHAAEDAAQEAFVVAYRAIAELRDGAAFGGWVRRIARRQALAIAAKGKPVLAGLDVAGEVAAPEAR